MRWTTPGFGEWLHLRPWLAELRHAARALARAPAFSAAVLGSLALCLGPNAALLGALYALALKPLPFPAPDRLVTVVNLAARSGGQRVQSSTPQYADFRARADRFAAVALFRPETATWEEGGDTARVPAAAVTPEFFAALGVRPELGRFFDAGEAVPGRDTVVVLTHAFWTSRCAADPGVIGSPAHLGGRACTIIGVAPPGVESLSANLGFLYPYAPPPAKFDPQARYRGDVTLVARLQPGVTRAAGAAQLAALEADFLQHTATPATRTFVANAGFRLLVEPLRPGAAAADLTALWLAQGGALLVLLIGGLNVVHLFLARLTARRRELAVRAALGASRTALLRHTLAESALLSAGATVAGLALGAAALQVFNRYLPLLVPHAPPVALEASAVGLGALLAAATALVTGLLPLRLLARDGLPLTPTAAAGRGGLRGWRQLCVSGQVALAVVLLVGASLLLRSFARVAAVDPGFDAARLVHARVALPGRFAPAGALTERYRSPQAADNLALQRRILDAVAALPGVTHAAAALDSLIVANLRPVPFGMRGTGAAAGDDGSQPLIHIQAVSPEFFATLGLPVRSGRGFTAADDYSRAPVAVVDASFAARYFPGRVVEGQEIFLSRGLPLAVESWTRIVGVVGRAQFTGLDSRDELPTVYVPLVGYPMSGFEVLARSPRPAAELAAALRAQLLQVEPGVTVADAGSLAAGLDDLLLPRRGVTLLAGAFSGLALLLAALGLYGVLAYDVAQRTRELGIRGALGATRAGLVRLVVAGGLLRTGLGLGAGLLAAAFVTRSLRGLLFGVAAADPASYLAAAGLLGAAALLACWLPARRAARVDPAVALRAE